MMLVVLDVVQHTTQECTSYYDHVFSLQLTEVGTMNIFVHWTNEKGGRKHIYVMFLYKLCK